MKSERHVHDYVKVNEVHVECSDCGKIQYISKLTPNQRVKLTENTLTKEEITDVEEGLEEIEQGKAKTFENVEEAIEELKEDEPKKYEPEPCDFLMWVGSAHYSIESFLAEARKMGCCKRVPMLPRGVVVGKSRVFLVHDQNEFERKTKIRSVARIFGYFIVRGISYVVEAGTNIPEELKERGITEYEYVEGEFGFKDERGCGSLQIGGTYLLSEEDMKKCEDLAKSGTLEGKVHPLNPMVPTNLGRFRGFKCVDGDGLLGGASEIVWLERGNATYLKNKKALRKWKSEKKKLEGKKV